MVDVTCTECGAGMMWGDEYYNDMEAGEEPLCTECYHAQPVSDR